MRAWHLSGRWPDGGRRSTVAWWTRRRAAPAYAPIPDLTWTITKSVKNQTESRTSKERSWRLDSSVQLPIRIVEHHFRRRVSERFAVVRDVMEVEAGAVE